MTTKKQSGSSSTSNRFRPIKWYTPAEVSQYMRVSKETVRIWLREGKVFQPQEVNRQGTWGIDYEGYCERTTRTARMN